MPSPHDFSAVAARIPSDVKVHDLLTGGLRRHAKRTPSVEEAVGKLPERRGARWLHRW